MSPIGLSARRVVVRVRVVVFGFALRSAARITRYGLDAYAYARLAGGTVDLVAESGLKSWDVAALIPVVRGAGGLATDWRGNAPALGGQIVCSSSEAVLEQALLALRRAAD